MSLIDAEASGDGFWNEDLQQSIQAAGQHGKTLLCFVSDESQSSKVWEGVIANTKFRKALQESTIRLRLRKDTQEFVFLTGVCPISHFPALVLIKGGQIEQKLESNVTSVEDLEQNLTDRYSSPEEEGFLEEASTSTIDQCLEFISSTGRMRLPNNAYDALREHTEKMLNQKISAKNILLLQLRMLDNIPGLKKDVSDIRSRPTGVAPTLSDEVINRLLNMPASALQPRSATSPSPGPASSSAPFTPDTSTPVSSTAPSPPPETATSATPVSSQQAVTPAPAPAQYPPQPRSSTPSAQQSQRADYIRQQHEREAAQRAERDRIKAQIKSDREERRRLDTIRKQGELATLRHQNSTTSAPASTDIRIQVRTFDGSTLRTTFAKTATITRDVRPWIDETNSDANKVPYNLKLILTPLPNRNIEAGEEDMVLPDLGIVGSATLVMAPVKGFVDSYAGSSTGMAGSVIGGLVGAGGSVINGVLGMLGWGSAATPAQQSQTTESSTTVGTSNNAAESASSSGSQVKVRTLADQRADDAKRRGNQLYNGNSLDFQGRKDDDDRKLD